jgi:predicted DNA-binding transcriptional regulator YafY
MNRTERLYALREELRRAGPGGRTAEALAATFEVSTRTVKRDITALQQSGLPVWARLGRIGGYVVEATATLPPVNFTAAEVSGLAAALAAHRGQPFDAHARAALAKILAVADERTGAAVGQLAGRIWVNDDRDRSLSTRTRSAVEQALQERRVVSLRYRDGNDEVTQRRVSPQLLAFTGGDWHLVAYCHLREAVRWFRLGRIEQARLTSAAATDLPLADIGDPPATAKPASAVTSTGLDRRRGGPDRSHEPRTKSRRTSVPFGRELDAHIRR